jgi:hypothetical protein
MFDPYSPNALAEQMKKAMVDYFTSHEAAFERMTKRISAEWAFVMMLLMWPYIYLFTYAVLVAFTLIVWYGIVRTIGFDVPPGNLFEAIWSYYESPIPHFFILIGAFFIVAFWIFLLRTYYRALYGLVEMVVGAIIASSVGFDDPDQKKVLLTLAGGIYVMVRGLDNVDKTLPADSAWSHTLRDYAPFFRYWIVGDFFGNRQTSLQNVSDPSYWRAVAGKDPLAPPDIDGERDVPKT